MIELVCKRGHLMVPVTIHAIIGSEDIIDAMDLRAFGVGPCTWLEELNCRRCERALIASGILMLVVPFALLVVGWGEFWIPEALLSLAGG